MKIFIAYWMLLLKRPLVLAGFAMALASSWSRSGPIITLLWPAMLTNVALAQLPSVFIPSHASCIPAFSRHSKRFFLSFVLVACAVFAVFGTWERPAGLGAYGICTFSFLFFAEILIAFISVIASQRSLSRSKAPFRRTWSDQSLGEKLSIIPVAVLIFSGGEIFSWFVANPAGMGVVAFICAVLTLVSFPHVFCRIPCADRGEAQTGSKVSRCFFAVVMQQCRKLSESALRKVPEARALQLYIGLYGTGYIWFLLELVALQAAALVVALLVPGGLFEDLKGMEGLKIFGFCALLLAFMAPVYFEGIRRQAQNQKERGLLGSFHLYGISRKSAFHITILMSLGNCLLYVLVFGELVLLTSCLVVGNGEAYTTVLGFRCALLAFALPPLAGLMRRMGPAASMILWMPLSMMSFFMIFGSFTLVGEHGRMLSASLSIWVLLAGVIAWPVHFLTEMECLRRGDIK